MRLGLSSHALSVPVISTTFSLGQKFTAFCITLIPTTVTLAVFYRAIQLFDLYKHHVIYSPKNVALLRKIAGLLLLRQCIEPFYQALLTPVLTWHNPAGQRMIAISFTQINFGLLTLSFCILLISLIMQEGLKLKEDNAAFI